MSKKMKGLLGLLGIVVMATIFIFARPDSQEPVIQEPEYPVYDEIISEYEEENDDEIEEDIEERVSVPGLLVVGRTDEVEERVRVPIETPIDFGALQEINPDIYAWIIIPGTPVDYPILQCDGDDQEFYLHHTFERVPSIEGSVFTQNYNGKFFEDRNTVIYGHDMLDGSIFGSLRNFRNEDHRREHDTIIIYTPYNILEYRIFSIVIFDDRHLMYAFDFEDEEGFDEFLEELLSSREVIYWSDYFDVTFDDRLITLATCTVAVDERLLIVAVLVDYEGELFLEN